MAANEDDQVLRGLPPASIPSDRVGKVFYSGPFYEELSSAAFMPISDVETDGVDGADAVQQLLERRVTHLEQVLNTDKKNFICFLLSD